MDLIQFRAYTPEKVVAVCLNPTMDSIQFIIDCSR